MAFGATRTVILRQIVSRVLVLVGVGVLIGMVATLWAARCSTAGDPGDSLMIIGAVSLLTAIGALAGFVPAWRADQRRSTLAPVADLLLDGPRLSTFA